MEEDNSPRNVAIQRFMMIAPLLEPGLDQAELRCRRQEIVENQEYFCKTKVSERTIRRHLEAYRKEGFDGLYPKIRSDIGNRGPCRKMSWMQRRF
jgi:putative transposase